MVNFLFGLLLGGIVGLAINASMKYVMMYFFADKVEKMLKKLETDITMKVGMGSVSTPKQSANPFDPRYN